MCFGQSPREVGGALEVGELLELIEVADGDLVKPMAFINAWAYERMHCGRWLRVGAEAGVRLVSLDCVETAVVRSKQSTACYLPYQYR